MMWALLLVKVASIVQKHFSGPFSMVMKYI